MKINKRNIGLLVAFMLLAFSNCSGINIFADIYGVQNTNPTPKYSNLYGLLFTGGGVFHKNATAAGVGFNATKKIAGEGCSHSVLYLVSWGDSSIYSVKKEFKIEKISHVEYEQMGIFGFGYHRFCTNVYGE